MITIKRLKAAADHTRLYEIIVDGNNVGAVGNGQEYEFDVSPGEHVINMKLDYGGSRKIRFTSKKGENITFETQSALAGAKVILAVFYAVLFFNRGIKLKMINE